MQKVQDFIASLAYGTLKNLHESIVDNKTHTVKESAIPEIIHWLNEGLTSIHTTYEIKDVVSVHIHESRTLYPIRSEYNMSLEEYLKLQPPYERFLWKNLEEEYNNNLMQVVLVTTHEGVKLPLNDASNMFSVFTPEYDVLQLPVNLLGGVLDVVYRAKHPEVKYEENTPIKLPPLLYDALANYIAYKIHSGMNTDLSVKNAEKYLQEYTSIINHAIENGVIENDHTPDFSKFYLRGFV